MSLYTPFMSSSCITKAIVSGQQRFSYVQVQLTKLLHGAKVSADAPRHKSTHLSKLLRLYCSNIPGHWVSMPDGEMYITIICGKYTGRLVPQR